jgi:hypothetical protein
MLQVPNPTLYNAGVTLNASDSFVDPFFPEGVSAVAALP